MQECVIQLKGDTDKEDILPYSISITIQCTVHTTRNSK